MSSGVNREIVTLQFGHYANFVGTHWWNIQSSSFIYHQDTLTTPKEINNDVLFREGENILREVTYTPRLIICDLKGSLNSLKETGTLYDAPEAAFNNDGIWMGNVAKHKCGGVTKNEFLRDLDYEEARLRGSAHAMDTDNDEKEKAEMDVGNSGAQKEVFGHKVYDLNDSVVVWSDFLKLHLHPKTLEVVRNYQHNNELETFDVFGYGVEAYRAQQQDVEDRLHFFAEECDNLEGFNLMVDTYNAFGGLASSFLADILDDYSKKAVVIYSVSPASFPSASVNEEQHRLMNLALSYEALLPNSSVFLPLSTSASLWKNAGPFCRPPYLQYKPNLPYHSSALLAASIDTMTLPLRLENNPTSMTDMATSLTMFGRKLVSTHTSLPFPINDTGSFLETMTSSGDTNIGHHLYSMTPYISQCCDSPYSQFAVCRGVNSPGSRNSLSPAGDKTQSVNDVLLSHLERVYKTSYSLSWAVRQPCKVVSPYPNVFSPQVTKCGLISARNRPVGQGVETVPVVTLLQSSADGKTHLDAIHAEVARLKLPKLHSFTNAGLELDQFTEMMENLKSHISCYDESERMDMN